METQMKIPLLSICIATYNRAEYIGETIDSIIPQLDDDVELLVVDGASSDNTEDIVQEFAQKDHHIRYVRLPSKGGVDQDYDKSVELARGEFCWLFTDDDLLKPGAVDYVITAIREGYGLIIVNAEVRDCKFIDILEQKRLSMRENKIYDVNQMESLFIDALAYISFIGAIVIRRSIWLSRERELYFGTEFIHVCVIFQKPLPEATIIIAEPYISIRYGNSQWTPRSFDIWMFKWPKLVWSFAHISDQAKQHITLKDPWRILRNLIFQRGIGTYTSMHYHKYFSGISSAGIWKISAWLISQLPIKVLAHFLYCYNRLVRNNALTLYDLNAKRKG